MTEVKPTGLAWTYDHCKWKKRQGSRRRRRASHSIARWLYPLYEPSNCMPSATKHRLATQIWLVLSLPFVYRFNIS